jgi:hypothetical protein
MSNDSVERVCEVCNQEIPKWRSKSATVCSFGCQLKRRAEKRQEAAEKRKEKRKTERKVKAKDSVLFHDCIFGGGGGIDPFVPWRCKCRKLVSEEKAQSLIARGEALDFETRTPVFAGGAIVQIGKLLRTPRSATVEKAHVARLVEKPEKKAREKTKSLEELRVAVAQDKAERFEEEQLRLEIFNELTVDAQRRWIVQVPAEEYDAKERDSWGRPGTFSFDEERTSHGVDVVGLGVLDDETTDKHEKEEIVPADVRDEIEVEEEQQSEDERSAEEVMAEYARRV